MKKNLIVSLIILLISSCEKENSKPAGPLSASGDTQTYCVYTGAKIRNSSQPRWGTGRDCITGIIKADKWVQEAAAQENSEAQKLKSPSCDSCLAYMKYLPK